MIFSEPLFISIIEEQEREIFSNKLLSWMLLPHPFRSTSPSNNSFTVAKILDN